MDSTVIFLISIALVILIIYLATPTIPIQEKFTTCENNPYSPRNMETIEPKKRVRFSEDENINIPLESQLVPRVMKNPGELNNWKRYYLNKFDKGSVKRDINFEGTQVRNYLDSIKYFHN